MDPRIGRGPVLAEPFANVWILTWILRSLGPQTRDGRFTVSTLLQIPAPKK